MYLEQYVESTTTLPAELQRILSTIRFLDDRSNALRAMVAAQTEELVAMPQQGQRTPEQDAVRKGGKGMGIGTAHSAGVHGVRPACPPSSARFPGDACPLRPGQPPPPPP